MMPQDDFINLNRNAYDSASAEFKEKIKLRHAKDSKIIQTFSQFLGSANYSVLDLGPGSGYMSKLLTENNYRVTAIELSPKMAALAKETAPAINLVIGDFLSHDFHAQKYDGILAVAFIHLFPGNITSQVLNKMHCLLNDGGIAFIATTKHLISDEGILEKDNFEGKQMRFRHRFTESELAQFLEEAGFKTLHYYENADENEGVEKLWMNFIVQK